MRRRARRRLAAAASLLFAAPAFAAPSPYAWDANGNAAGSGGAGNWNVTDAVWTPDGTNFVAWPSAGTENVANFGGAGGVVTANANVAANRLNFTSAGYALASSGGSILTLNGTTPTIDTGGQNVTLGLAANGLTLASGVTSVTKSGNGTLTLINNPNIGANVTWNVNGVAGATADATTGTYASGIAFTDAAKFGNSSGSVIALNASQLSFTQNGGSGFFSARTVNVGTAGGAISDGGFAPGMAVSGGSTISPKINIASGAGLNLIANNTLTFDTGNGGTGAGQIAGAGGITVYGTGRAKILSTGHTYTGGTTIKPGATLMIGGPTSLGTGSGNLTLGGRLDLNGSNLAVGALTSTGGTLDFRANGATANQLTAASATMTGTTRVTLGTTTGVPFSAGTTYTVATSTAGGLAGNYVASFLPAGGQNLSIPVTAVIQNIGGVPSRLTAMAAANAGGTAVTLTTAAAPAPAKTISILPLGSSITAGTSAQVPYDGGGYRSQLYQQLVNDGRFTPRFVGKETGSQSNSPTGVDLMATVGQPNHEGHPGFRTDQIRDNLDAGSNYLSVGNGIEPDYVTLNVGGNDYVQSPTSTTAINRLGEILGKINTLRPNATVVVSSIVTRTDGNGAYANGFNTLYNPLIPGLVQKHVLAGGHASFLDLASVMNVSDLSSDGIHPTQAGYNKMADAWYGAVTKGQAFFTGNAGNTWNATGAGGTTSFAMDFGRSTDAGVAPSASTDVYFNGGGAGANTLGADFTVRSVNFAANANAPVSIGGANTLTIGAGGVTVQAGTAAHTIASNVKLDGAQTWASVATNRFTVSGNVANGSTAGPLTLGGSGTFVLSGNNTYTGGTNVGGTSVAGTAIGGTPTDSVTLVAANAAGSATGAGTVTVAAGSTLTGTGTTGPVAVSGTITAGSATGSIATLGTGAETWNAAGRLVAEVAADGASNDRLTMPALSITAAAGNPFAIAVTGTGSPALAPTDKFTLATVADNSAANPFAPTAFDATTRDKLALAVTGLQPAAGYTFRLATEQLRDAQQNAIGYGLVLTQVAVPEPAGLLCLGAAAAPLLLGRRRRR